MLSHREKRPNGGFSIRCKVTTSPILKGVLEIILGVNFLLPTINGDTGQDSLNE